jgi:Ca2+-binding EF-hand superfamily protein
MLLMFALASFVPADSSAQGGERLPRPFSVHDTNRDGYLSREEYAAFRQKAQAVRTHHPGRLSRFRLMAFEQIDQDRDEKISESEMVSALQRRLHERRRHRHRLGQPR